MNDRILDGYLQDFRDKQELDQLEPTELFASFANHCIVSRLLGTEASLDEINVDGGQDSGLDAVAILVNNKIVTDITTIDYFIESGRIDVEFMFAQNTASARFEADKIGSFLFGVSNFFKPSTSVPISDKIKLLRSIKDHVYEKSIHLRVSPKCRIYYVSTGKWTDDAHLKGRIDSQIADIKSTGLFSDVLFMPIDAEKLKAYYRELRHSVEREVNFEKHTILPSITGVRESYLGILPSDDFLKLVTDEDGEIINGLFYDNVRDFQGSTSVNVEIKQTLTTQGKSECFVLLNNGVTIVAKSINKIGAKFRITDYQIVNGCQTSHVLQQNKDSLGPSVYLPVKLIVTNDPELTSNIIHASNSQTEVKREAFESLKPFHRKLEEFYHSFSRDPLKVLFYERRSKQYERSAIHPNSIISLATQSVSFLAMFLNAPHSFPNYYGQILEANRDRMFREEHSPYPYYTSALALSRLEELFRNRRLPGEFKKFRFHLLLVLRLRFENSSHFPLEGKSADEKCERICQVLWDKSKALAEFEKSCTDLKRVLNHFLNTSKDIQGEPNKLRAFTDALLPHEKRSRPNGQVKYWNEERQFGFIASDGIPEDIYVHWTAIQETTHRYLRVGEKVEFDLSRSDKGYQARYVVLSKRVLKGD